MNESYYKILLTLITSIGSFFSGSDTSIISVLVGFVKSRFHLNEGPEGRYVSSALLVSIAGVTSTGATGDYYGSKNILIVPSLFSRISAAGYLIVTGFIQPIIDRFLDSIGVGPATGRSADFDHVKDRISINDVLRLCRALSFNTEHGPVRHPGNKEQKHRRD